jgi:hypothetical protein|tara:strand:+ start:128 stop:328 length:201 start_codon:yes stop_codon:yes gene_type:complete
MGVIMAKELFEIAQKIHDADTDLNMLRSKKHNCIYDYEVDEISGVINYVQFKIKALKEKIERRLKK